MLKTSQATQDRRFYAATLKSDECQCDAYKQPGFAFCFKCYRRLPQEMQRALYRKIGAGFEAAYEEAYRHLNNL